MWYLIFGRLFISIYSIDKNEASLLEKFSYNLLGKVPLASCLTEYEVRYMYFRETVLSILANSPSKVLLYKFFPKENF